MVRKPAEEAEERSEAEAQGGAGSLRKGRHPRTEQVAWWALMRVRLLGLQPETWAGERKGNL